MREAVIASAILTPVGKFGGSLAGIPSVDLGSLVIGEAPGRVNMERDQVDEVIMGNVRQAGLGQNPARQAALKAGLPCKTPAWTLNKSLWFRSQNRRVGCRAHSVRLWRGDSSRRYGKHDRRPLCSG